MKKSIIIASFILLSSLFGQKNPVMFSVMNPISLQRTSETISLDLNGLYQHHPELKGKNIVVEESKKPLVIQWVDENSDGVFDALLFQSSFKPKETKQFAIRTSDKPQGEVSPMVDGRYVLPREDFAWENDRIAFRIYGSALAGNVDNGIDVWTKRVRYPIVKKWYDGEVQTPKIIYHEDHGEGADFFSVGRSLGAGSAGIFWNGKLVQPGLFTHYRIITNGPIRISFEAYYPSWRLDTIKYLEVKRITLDAGEQMNTIEERFVSNSTVESLTIAGGLVKRNNTTIRRSSDNRWMSLWGLTTDDTVNGHLGTAVVFPFSFAVSAGEDTNQYYISTTFDEKQTLTYFSGAAWTRMGDIASENEWTNYLEEFTVRVNNPLIISFKQKR